MKPLIFIDAGHGGSDPGAVVPGLREADLNLKLATKIHDLLQTQFDTRAVLSRATDIYIPVGTRANMANLSGVSHVVSIHMNSFTNADAAGYEVWKFGSATETARLAKFIQTCLVQAMPMFPNRGIKDSEFMILKATKAPACLIEFGFLTDPAFRIFITRPGQLHDLAYVVAKALWLLTTGGK
jgi:N-acetylmuramoyl-L-alanine amidase